MPATGNLRSFDKSLWRENRRATAPNGQYLMSHFSSFNTAMTNWLIRCLSPIKGNRRWDYSLTGYLTHLVIWTTAICLHTTVVNTCGKTPLDRSRTRERSKPNNEVIDEWRLAKHAQHLKICQKVTFCIATLRHEWRWSMNLNWNSIWQILRKPWRIW